MPTHIALLRGINLGGHKKVAMADLRDVVGSLGHQDVSTYINSGNVLFTTDGSDTAAMAADLERVVADRLGVQSGVIVLTRDELAQAARDNPYADEPDPKRVHVIFLPADQDLALVPGRAEALAALQEQAAAKGSSDTVTQLGRVVYLHTPDGFGTSELAKLLGKAGGPMSAKGAGTARNWSTVTKLLGLCE